MMQITSSVFADGEMIPSRYTCDGGDVCPELVCSDVPESATSLALVMDDPDAPGGTWTHWTVWNILSDTGVISADALPDDAVEGITSAGTTGWHGPCPPSGSPALPTGGHRYVFTLYALDAKMPEDAGMDANALRAAMKDHIIEHATLTGIYSRS